jgi:hypothetical protein
VDLSFPADMMFKWQLVSSLAFASIPCSTNPDERLRVACLQECVDALQPLVVEGDKPLPFGDLQAWDEARILELAQAVPGGYQTHNGLSAFCLYVLPEVLSGSKANPLWENLRSFSVLDEGPLMDFALSRPCHRCGAIGQLEADLGLWCRGCSPAIFAPRNAPVG